MPDRGLRRAAHLELGDHAVDSLYVRVHGPAVVAADGVREGDVADLGRHLGTEIDALRRRLRRLALGHEASMTDWDQKFMATRTLQLRDVSQRLPQVTSAELIAELEQILIELRRRLDGYLEQGADDIVAADEGFNFAGQIHPLLSELVDHAVHVRERLLQLQEARP